MEQLSIYWDKYPEWHMLIFSLLGYVGVYIAVTLWARSHIALRGGRPPYADRILHMAFLIGLILHVIGSSYGIFYLWKFMSDIANWIHYILLVSVIVFDVFLILILAGKREPRVAI